MLLNRTAQGEEPVSTEYVAILLVAGLFAVGACGPSGPPFEPPSQLIGDFRSGISLEQAKSVESAKGLRWEVVERERYRLPTSGEEVVLVCAETSGYSHYGVQGTLSLWLYNDLLTKATFYPTNLEEYLAEYEKREGVNLRSTGLGYDIDNTWVWLWATPAEEFIGWRDRRLVDYFTGSD